MNTGDISVKVHSVKEFHYRQGDKARAKISHPKTQYAHRFIYFTGGELDVTVCGERRRVGAGTVVYLVPGEEYRLLPSGKDFSLVNIFFELMPREDVPREMMLSCVFLDGFRRGLCPTTPEFSDAPMLSHSRIFEDGECGRIVAELVAERCADEHFSLYARAKILEMIYRMMRSERHSSVGAERIIGYINDNPTADLSATAIAKRFGYHKNHVNRLIKSAVGRTLSECVRRSRISYARTLLSELRMPPSEIALELGFYDYSHFYKAFFSEMGCTPSEYAARSEK